MPSGRDDVLHPLKVSVQFKSDARLRAAFKKLSITDQMPALKNAVREAAKPIKMTAKALAPRDTGTLQASIGERFKSFADGRVYVVIGPRRGSDYWGATPQGRPRMPTKYAHLVERGHAIIPRGKAISKSEAVGLIGKGATNLREAKAILRATKRTGFVPGVFFMSRAMAVNATLARSILNAHIARAIQAASR